CASFALCILRSGDGPFLHPCEVVIRAVAALPHRQDQRLIWLLFVLESLSDACELLERAFGMEVRVAILEINRHAVARGIAALQRDIDQLGDRGIGRDIGKSTVAQNRGLERELRRDADAHLLFARHLSGFVVENGITPAREPLDTVGTRAQGEHALAERNLDPALQLGGEHREARAAPLFPAGEPAGNPPETWPPERARFGIVFKRSKMLAADVDER